MIRYTILFSCASIPNVGTPAAVRTGGWSESIWKNSDVPDPIGMGILMSRRRNMLPRSCTISGYRQQLFTFNAASVLVAGGAQTVLNTLAGNTAFAPDVPQMAAMCNASSAAGVNTRKFSLRGIPDEMVENGEAAFTPAFKGMMTNYFDELVTGAWGFRGRDLTQPILDIVGVAAGVLTFAAAPPFVVGEYCELIKCKTLEGVPVTGKFRVTAVGALTLTLQNFPNISGLLPSSKCTRYVDKFFQITDATFSRIVVRKVGRPFVGYRGRRSKRPSLK